jgi:FAD/FMN-containing dehydrogenase
MSKIAQYLQEHLQGEVVSSAKACQQFSTDGSVLQLTPQMVVYPRSEEDIRKTARLAWQLAQRGRSIPVTARGLGANLAGAALGDGLVLVLPAHINKLLFLDSGKGLVTVQPGMNYGALQQVLQTHGIFLPPYPASLEFCTIGGAIANNASGEKSLKYGVTKDYINWLRVVLANGEVIITGPLSKRELERKKGLASLEGEVYRAVDGLLVDNKELLEQKKPTLSRNVAGYNLWDIKDGKGNFDLTPLFIGSQGTLGIITEVTLTAISYNPITTLVAGFFDDITQVNTAVENLRKLQPSAIKLISNQLLDFVEANNPGQLKDLASQPFAKVTLLVEFDDTSPHQQKSKAKKAKKIFTELAKEYKLPQNELERADLYRLWEIPGTIHLYGDGKKALPIIDDAVIVPAKMPEFLPQVDDLFQKLGIQYTLWGSPAEGLYHIQPVLDLNTLGDRQKVFKLMDSFYGMVIDMGGAISGGYNDGRLRAPFVKLQYGDEIYNLFEKVKLACDPHSILNPGVKIGVKMGDVQPLLRHEYSLDHC